MLGLLVLVGCTPTGPYRTRIADDGCVVSPSDACGDASFLKNENPAYDLAFLELDEQGVMQQRAQLETVLKHLRRQNNNYVIVYVHGWHHSAAADDSNVLRFQERLAFTKQRYPEKNVTGIYVGWRGESISVPGLNMLTFWDRKVVSEEVGRNSLSEALLRIESALPRESNNVLLTVGHSFGASVVFNSVHQIMLTRLVQPRPGDVIGFGDLVVLVNPAFEAMRFTQIRDAAQVRQHDVGFSDSQGPVLIVAASEGDLAVGTAFPLGRLFSTSLETHRAFQPPHRRTAIQENGYIDERALDMQGLGHVPAYTSHRLEANEAPGRDYACPDNRGWLRAAVAREKQLPGRNPSGEGWDTGFAKTGNHHRLLTDPAAMQIRHLNRSGPFDPYWIVSTHKNVLPDHSSITQKHFWCFIDAALQEGGARLRPPLVVQELGAVE